MGLFLQSWLLALNPERYGLYFSIKDGYFIAFTAVKVIRKQTGTSVFLYFELGVLQKTSMLVNVIHDLLAGRVS